ncbi:MAG: hypothetical protein Q4C44_03390 [bacterium]|nr:hypothetical protein [bacterium]
MNEGKNNTVMLTVIGIATLLIAVVGATFAFFSAQLSGSDTEYKVVSATIGTEFTGGDEVVATGIFPQDAAWATKVFSIKSTSSLGVETKYNIALTVDANDVTEDATISSTGAAGGTIKAFSANALSYSLTATETGANSAHPGTMPKTTGQVKIADATKTINLGQATVYGNGDTTVTQTYTLSLFFPRTDADQNADQGAQFKAHIAISEVQ